MAQPESSSSFSLEYNPQKFGPGTSTDKFDQYRIIEQGAHRRKAGNTKPRVIHIVDTEGDEPTKTIRVAHEGEYSTFHIKEDGSDIVREIQVNGNHFRVNNGEAQGKYTFGGMRIPESEHAIQLPLETTTQLTLDDALLLQEARTPIDDGQLPDFLDTSVINLFKDIATTARSPKTPMLPGQTVRLGSIFDELTPPSSESL